MDCDKCGKPVDPDNDVYMLESLLGNIEAVFSNHSRHLLPTEDCVGSPSRAQYLVDQPRDTRSLYQYNVAYENPYRQAWVDMQEMAPFVN